MKFECTVLNEKGQEVKYWFEAGSEASLKKQLDEKGWKPVKVTVDNKITDANTLKGFSFLRRGKRIHTIFFIYLLVGLTLGLVLSDFKSEELAVQFCKVWFLPLLLATPFAIYLDHRLFHSLCPVCHERFF